MSRPFAQSSEKAAAAATRAQRQFGGVFSVVFVLVAVGPLWRGGAVRLWAVAVAAVLLAIAWWAPAWLKGPNALWLKFGEIMHRITSPLALAVVYVVGVAPVGVIMRLLGKDPLRLARQPDAATYWIHRMPPGRADARMKNQF